MSENTPKIKEHMNVIEAIVCEYYGSTDYRSAFCVLTDDNNEGTYSTIFSGIGDQKACLSAVSDALAQIITDCANDRGEMTREMTDFRRRLTRDCWTHWEKKTGEKPPHMALKDGEAPC